VGIENPGGELAGGGIAEEFDVKRVVAEFDESAAVGCGVDVGVRVVMARVGFATGGFGIVLVLGVL
jgi:hypothetical protein